MEVIKVGLGEISQNTLDVLLTMLEDGKQHSIKLKKASEKEHLEFKDGIPLTSNARITNASQLACSTDACNQACKAQP